MIYLLVLRKGLCYSKGFMGDIRRLEVADWGEAMAMIARNLGIPTMEMDAASFRNKGGDNLLFQNPTSGLFEDVTRAIA